MDWKRDRHRRTPLGQARDTAGQRPCGGRASNEEYGDDTRFKRLARRRPADCSPAPPYLGKVSLRQLKVLTPVGRLVLDRVRQIAPRGAQGTRAVLDRGPLLVGRCRPGLGADRLVSRGPASLTLPSLSACSDCPSRDAATRPGIEQNCRHDRSCHRAPLRRPSTRAAPPALHQRRRSDRQRADAERADGRLLPHPVDAGVDENDDRGRAHGRRGRDLGGSAGTDSCSDRESRTSMPRKASRRSSPGIPSSASCSR